MARPPSRRSPAREAQEAASLLGSATRTSQFTNLPRRIYLTYRYHGAGSVLLRALTFPIRFTPLARHLRMDQRLRARRATARAWFRRYGHRVTVVIPSYRDAQHVERLVRSLRRTTPAGRVRIIVSDDGSGPEHLGRLSAIRGIEIVAGKENLGYAANVNRGLRAVGAAEDVVVLNSDVVARRDWLATLQYAAHRMPEAGVFGAKLLYPDGRIQFGGTVRNLGAPEWFDHRFRFKPSQWGPANVPQRVLAVTGACMYVRRQVIETIGLFDESYPMAYEDVDFCLRAWASGFGVQYVPDAELVHLESVTRGTEFKEREQASQRLFWERWGDFFDARNVRTDDGRLRIVYVTQDTGVGGGHRVIFEHLNRLLARGHDVELWSLAGPPDWFDLEVPVRTFDDYEALREELAPLEAIKVATWWETAAAVWEASLLNGIAVYFVQDIEASYYRDSAEAGHVVLASYRHEFRYLTTSAWNTERLRELGLEPAVVPPGIDLETFRELPDVDRRRDLVLALGRTNPLKNLPLTLAAWRSLPEPRPELCLFGIEPQTAPRERGVSYIESPSDAQVNELLNRATLFLQTSSHEGFCLPVLEAMAAGCPAVATDAHGNRDYCEDGLNCLMPDAGTASVAAAVAKLLGDDELRQHLAAAGRDTAAAYGWPKRMDELERFFEQVASAPRPAYASEARPALRRSSQRG